MANLQRLIFVLMLLLGLSLSAHAENTRISDLFDSKGRSGNPDKLCNQAASELTHTNVPGGFSYVGGWSWQVGGTPTLLCPLAENRFWKNVSVSVSCPKGGSVDKELLGCYGEKPANTCPAAGTNFIEMMDGETVPTGSKGLTCLDGCQLKIPGDIVCVEVGGVLGCAAGGAGWVTYTGLECTGDEGDTGGGDGNEGEGDGEGEGEGDGTGEGDGDGTGDGDGSGDGSGDGDGSGGEGDGEGEGEGGNCVYVNGVEICNEGTGQDCVYINGAKVCQDGEGSKWSGDCKSGFSAEGDALAVAISKAEYERNCALLEEPEETDEYKYYVASAEASKVTDGKGILDSITETVNIGSGMIDTSSAIGGGSCIRDLSISVVGRSVSLPLSKICPYLSALGNLLVGLSMLLAARIILRG